MIDRTTDPGRDAFARPQHSLDPTDPGDLTDRPTPVVDAPTFAWPPVADAYPVSTPGEQAFFVLEPARSARLHSTVPPASWRMQPGVRARRLWFTRAAALVTGLAVALVAVAVVRAVPRQGASTLGDARAGDHPQPR